MRMALEGNIPIELVAEPMEVGQKVKITGGPMKGAEGEYIHTKHKTFFIINLSQIGYSLKLEIPASDVIKL